MDILESQELWSIRRVKTRGFLVEEYETINLLQLMMLVILIYQTSDDEMGR